jgi:hypothetical protein
MDSVLRIRNGDSVPFWPLDLDPGWVKKIQIQDPVENNFWGKNYLNSLMRIQDPGTGLEKSFPGSGIRISDPGSGINIPDPQNCMDLFVFGPHIYKINSHVHWRRTLVLFWSLLVPFWGLEEFDPDSLSIILDHRSLQTSYRVYCTVVFLRSRLVFLSNSLSGSIISCIVRYYYLI